MLQLQEGLTRGCYAALMVMKGLVLGMTEYTRIVWIDSDMLVLENFSEVVAMPSGTGAPGLSYGEPFNGGVLPRSDMSTACSP
jgi:alpha-N-acetylglucosamine transferase